VHADVADARELAREVLDVDTGATVDLGWVLT
jgi:hypothetical protein